MSKFERERESRQNEPKSLGNSAVSPHSSSKRSPLPSEKTAQELFYEQFKIPADAAQHNCDGYRNGNILEFKKSNRTTINSALFQCIKYLSSFRVKGIPVPANILLVFPSDKHVHVFKSENYRQYIHKLYNDSASRNTKNFTKLTVGYETIDYATDEGVDRLMQLLHKDKPQWVKIQIDEHCVVGWAQTFYRLKPNAIISFSFFLQKNLTQKSLPTERHKFV